MAVEAASVDSYREDLVSSGVVIKTQDLAKVYENRKLIDLAAQLLKLKQQTPPPPVEASRKSMDRAKVRV